MDNVTEIQIKSLKSYTTPVVDLEKDGLRHAISTQTTLHEKFP